MVAALCKPLLLPAALYADHRVDHLQFVMLYLHLQCRSLPTGTGRLSCSLAAPAMDQLWMCGRQGAALQASCAACCAQLA